MVDKRMTEEDVVAELRDGMTIGIGGWGSRRKPMSIVRAIANSDLKDLTIASYAGVAHDRAIPVPHVFTSASKMISCAISGRPIA